MSVRKKLIIDCDPGTDDAHAILMALAASDSVELVAITTVYGNALVEDTTRNALRLLTFCNRLDIPIFKGCSSSLTFNWKRSNPSNPYHGHDGFGDVVIDGVDPVDVAASISSEHASTALCRLTAQQPGHITLVAIGPLTNIAVALMLDNQLGQKLAGCVIMGGNYMGQRNMGAGTCAEYNWSCDPEAVHCVLSSLNTRITIAPFETCEDSSFSWEWYESACQHPFKWAKFLKDILQHTVNLVRNRGGNTFQAYDQLAVAYCINPAVAVATTSVHATVELHGTLTRGQMIVDWKGRLQDAPVNVNIITAVNQPLYEQLALLAFQLD